MNPRVYVETSVISYLVTKPSGDLIVAAHQKLTRDWWQSAHVQFALCSSIVTREEAQRGDAAMAALRLALLEPLPIVALTEDAIELAEALLAAGALPSVAYQDALHVAVCAVQRVEILVTWNCKHIANARMFGIMERVCEENGYKLPRLCTPIELWGN